MSTTEQGAKGTKFSMARLMLTILIVILFAVVAYQYGLQQVPKNDPMRTTKIFGLDKAKPMLLADIYTDADGDSVADAPAEADRWVDPQAILFSYVAAPNAESYEKTWKPLVDHLSAVTGKPVQYVRYESARDQLLAMREGRLHVTAVNTGNVPEAVNLYGFVPVASPADAEGNHGYTMNIIVPKGSAIKTPTDLKGGNIAFTDPGSNSGCKAPMVLLGDFSLAPDQDYHFVFSRGHEQSIAGVASGNYPAAATASDMLARALARGDIEKDSVATIYESERFPSAAIGYIYNLKPDLADKIREALLSFKVTDSEDTKALLAEGVAGFAPVSYKDDWALVRRIDSNVSSAN